MGKRKRNHAISTAEPEKDSPAIKKRATAPTAIPLANEKGTPPKSLSLQIITGSYDRILHGIIVTIPLQDAVKSKVHFQDNFLFTAHASAIKCLALSPLASHDSSDAGKVVLATGGTDERINLYTISTSLPSGPSLPTLSSVPSLENAKNRELGSLLHHNSSVNALYFPSKGKLISASDDNTIAISRTRDWTVLSTVKAPMPKVQGRPSGDTAPLGGAPAGITDFAVHPSMKLMISVGKGEKCMRLWNLVTGKKANVLTFDKDLLKAVGESKWSRGEGQRIVWNAGGDEFAITFERGVAIFGMDSEARCVAVPQPASKVHQVAYVQLGVVELLAVSTEDGRILFYPSDVDTSKSKGSVSVSHAGLQTMSPIAFLGGKETGVNGRIKDFITASTSSKSYDGHQFIITAGSDGSVMLWQLDSMDISSESQALDSKTGSTPSNGVSSDVTSNGNRKPRQIGRLLGKYDTGNRITCMTGFQLQVSPDLEEDGSEEKTPPVGSEQSSDDAAQNVEEDDEFSGFK